VLNLHTLVHYHSLEFYTQLVDPNLPGDTSNELPPPNNFERSLQQLPNVHQGMEPSLTHQQYAMDDDNRVHGDEDAGMDEDDSNESGRGRWNAPYRSDEDIINEIVHEARRKLSNTLVGQLATYIRASGAATAEVLVDQMVLTYQGMRKPDGTKYKGSITKAVHGALFSAGVFTKDGQTAAWALDDEKLREYEGRLERKFWLKSKHRKSLTKQGLERLQSVHQQDMVSSFVSEKRRRLDMEGLPEELTNGQLLNQVAASDPAPPNTSTHEMASAPAPSTGQAGQAAGTAARGGTVDNANNSSPPPTTMGGARGKMTVINMLERLAADYRKDPTLLAEYQKSVLGECYLQ
jgi:hypothetical protein